MDVYERDVPFLQQQFALQARYGGVPRGLANQLVKEYYFATPNQYGHPVMPTLNTPGSSDPVADAYGWLGGLYTDGYARGQQRFTRQQGAVPTKRGRGIAQTFTRELRDPETGQVSNLMNLSYMPPYPTATQVDIAMHQAEMHGAQRRNVDNDLYWRAANQSFRHQSRNY